MSFSRLKWGKYGAEILVKNIFYFNYDYYNVANSFQTAMPNCLIKKKGSFEINKKCHFFSKCVKAIFCSEAVLRSALLNNECHKFPKQRVIKYTVNVNKINVYLLNTRKCTCLIFMNNDFEFKKKMQIKQIEM